MDSISDIFRSIRVRMMKTDLDQAVRVQESQADRIARLEQEIQALELVCTAMWELFGRANGLFQKDLEAKMQEIDLRDGALDGKIGHTMVECGKCKRRSPSTRSVCVYCGADL